MSDIIREQVKKAFDKLEDKLLSEGFKTEEIEELKIDVEVGIKNNVSLSELIKTIQDAEKKVLGRKKSDPRKKGESKNLITSLLGESGVGEDYDSETIDAFFKSDDDREEIETQNTPQTPEALEATINTSSEYFTKPGGAEESIAEYAKNESEHEYESGEGQADQNTLGNVEKQREEEKRTREYQVFGKRPKDIYK
ncbi:hypothetical protein GOV05_03610 [Candidatus Woesearchaeota archaeon]|nr:hypothetical protein [Candidatus Woesearchaeota archaeon]